MNAKVYRKHMESDVRSYQIKIYRGMSPAKKLQTALDLYWSAWSLKACAIRAQNPTWTEAEIESAVRQTFMNASS